MRTIKFRGKQYKTGEWLVGDLIHFRNDVMILPLDADWFDFVPRKNNPFRLPSDRFVVDKATVGQFTGLTDKSGTPIYEGDIVKWLEVKSSITSVMEPPEYYIEECMDVVVFGAGAFTVEEAGYPDMAFLCKDYHYNEKDLFTWVCNLDDFPGVTTDDIGICEVIGNIHDNPELIEKGGQDDNIG